MTNAGITIEDLQERHDFGFTEGLVHSAVTSAIGSDEGLVRFLGRYISWNGHFGSGVAYLSAKIGRSQQLFLDPSERLEAAADRSTHVASFFFDAARDEFDDGATPYRDTHRTLAQATIKGTVEYFGLSLERANEMLRDPAWLRRANQRVHQGYGLGTPDAYGPIFRAMGYHLGSEILADEEFSLIDGDLRERRPALVKELLQRRVPVAGQEHPAYYWIGVHSGLGGGVEMDHFEWAAGGVRAGLALAPADLREELREEVLEGFSDFARCHTEFFERSNQ